MIFVYICALAFGVYDMCAPCISTSWCADPNIAILRSFGKLRAFYCVLVFTSFHSMPFHSIAGNVGQSKGPQECHYPAGSQGQHGSLMEGPRPLHPAQVWTV